MCFLSSKRLPIDAQQSDQRVAGHDIEVDIGQRLQVIELLRRADQRQEKAQFGDLGRFVHDVHAVEVVGDDLLADEVIDGWMHAPDIAEMLLQVGIVQHIDLAVDHAIDIEQVLHRRHQESPRATSRVQDGNLGQHVQENAAEVGIQPHQHITQVIELAYAALVDALQNHAVDAALAEVFGDLAASVIGAESLLVDIFLEDITQHIGVDFVVPPRPVCRPNARNSGRKAAGHSQMPYRECGYDLCNLAPIGA